MTETRMPEVGEPAPEIDAEVTQGGRFRLTEHRGKWVVLYFYVKAFTPGWCHEAEDFQSQKEELEALNATVVGVSADKPEVQARFVERFGLTFPVIADPGKTVIDAYGARAVLGLAAQRSTFLIDPEGRIAHVWPKVKVEGHAEDVIGVLRRSLEESG